jgi:ribonuclease Z
VTELAFLGTGNFLAPPGRYWNSFVMDESVLVEPAPTALPHLRRCGIALEAVEVVVVSHFHADHCFGWPFLLQALADGGGGRTLSVVGPPGIEAHLAHMNEAGAVASVTEQGRANLDLRFVEVDETWQQAGPLRFRAVEVVHVPYLRCFGYLVVECNGRHTPPGVQGSHMDEESVRDLQAAHPDVQLVLTHLGEQVDTASMTGVTIPDDFERLTV